MNNCKNIIFQIQRSCFQFKALDQKNRARDCQFVKNANVFTFFTQTLAMWISKNHVLVVLITAMDK